MGRRLVFGNQKSLNVSEDMMADRKGGALQSMSRWHLYDTVNALAQHFRGNQRHAVVSDMESARAVVFRIQARAESIR
jgi:hypothetical protein